MGGRQSSDTQGERGGCGAQGGGPPLRSRAKDGGDGCNVHRPCSSTATCPLASLSPCDLSAKSLSAWSSPDHMLQEKARCFAPSSRAGQSSRSWKFQSVGHALLLTVRALGKTYAMQCMESSQRNMRPLLESLAVGDVWEHMWRVCGKFNLAASANLVRRGQLLEFCLCCCFFRWIRYHICVFSLVSLE